MSVTNCNKVCLCSTCKIDSEVCYPCTYCNGEANISIDSCCWLKREIEEHETKGRNMDITMLTIYAGLMRLRLKEFDEECDLYSYDKESLSSLLFQLEELETGVSILRQNILEVVA